MQQRLNWLSFARIAAFLAFLFAGYKATQLQTPLSVILTVLLIAVFFVLVKWYDRLEHQTLFYKALAKFNQDEITFLQSNRSLYPSGEEYEDPHHPYSYDLDIFGKGGLFAHINRCSTKFGRQALAKALLSPDISQIAQKQQAVKELSEKNDFRQTLYAHGILHPVKEKDLQKLHHWIQQPGAFIGKAMYYVILAFSAATIFSIIYYFFLGADTAFTFSYSLFFINLILTSAFSKRISTQLSVAGTAGKILESHQQQLKTIEQQEWQSPLLQQYKQQLLTGQETASKSLGRLVRIFENLESVINIMVSILLNGLCLFHLHVLYALGKWQKHHAAKITDWLQVIGELEMLSSLGNFAYNNPAYCFPETTNKPAFAATDLGHPLLMQHKRICNDVSFDERRFIILTGSNMSGKSTFLRTLGVNLLLARAGSVVCAQKFRFYPFDIFVSMRITDSLQDSESFFYAELKRLQSIMQHLQEGNQTFVILDEILRGTNSNDKRNGTIGLIKKMVQQQTFGIIATHDVIVAELIHEYPETIANKAFESEIINDELLFDYKLKDGVCTKLSASYLMKKMGIIG
ncbi:MAG: DNA mismatch repair protein MutS [Niabella sp.]